MHVYIYVGGIVRVRMRIKSTCARGARKDVGAKKNEWNKWKNHFYEMKGDVGISLHEKERNKMPIYTKSQSHS